MAKKANINLSKEQAPSGKSQPGSQINLTRAEIEKGIRSAVSSDTTFTGTAGTRLSEVAKTAGLPVVYTSELVDRLATNMLMDVRKKGSVPEERIKKAFKELHPNGMYAPDDFKIPPDFLLGPAGHGKTSVMREASKKVASLLNLNWMDNPHEDEKVTENDYVFTSIEFAGANSPIQIKGMPTKKLDERTGKEHLSFLQNHQLTMLKKAGGATLLLDDLRNAYQSIISVAMPLLDESRYAGTHLSGVYIGATGNLGALDNTKVADMSAAMRTRANMLMVVDNANEEANRMDARFNGLDTIGGAYMVPFVRRFGEAMFDELPDAAQLGCYPTPRLLERATVNQRNNIKRAGGMDYALDGTMESFSHSVKSLMGERWGAVLGKYLLHAYKIVDPMAKNAIYTGAVNEDYLGDYHASGTSADDVDFFNQWSEGLVRWAGVKSHEDLLRVSSSAYKNGGKLKPEDWKDFKNTVERFVDGATRVKATNEVVVPTFVKFMEKVNEATDKDGNLFAHQSEAFGHIKSALSSCKTVKKRHRDIFNAFVEGHGITPSKIKKPQKRGPGSP